MFNHKLVMMDCRAGPVSSSLLPMVQYGVVWYDMMWYGIVRYGTVRYHDIGVRVLPYHTVWYSMVWNGMEPRVLSLSCLRLALPILPS